MSGSGATTIDFGVYPGSNEASTVITGETGILAGSETDAWISAVATVDHTLADHAYAASLVGVSTGELVPGTGFTVYGRSIHKMQGTFTVQWAWA